TAAAPVSETPPPLAAPARPPCGSIPALRSSVRTQPAPAAFRQTCSSLRCPRPPQNISGEYPAPRPAASAPIPRCSLRGPLRQSPQPSSSAAAASCPSRRPAPGHVAPTAPAKPFLFLLNFASEGRVVAP